MLDSKTLACTCLRHASLYCISISFSNMDCTFFWKILSALDSLCLWLTTLDCNGVKGDCNMDAVFSCILGSYLTEIFLWAKVFAL